MSVASSRGLSEEAITSTECIAVLVRAGFRVVATMNGVTVLLVHRGGVPVRVQAAAMISPETLSSILRGARLERARFDELLAELHRMDSVPDARSSRIVPKGPFGATG